MSASQNEICRLCVRTIHGLQQINACPNQNTMPEAPRKIGSKSQKGEKPMLLHASPIFFHKLQLFHVNTHSPAGSRLPGRLPGRQGSTNSKLLSPQVQELPHLEGVTDLHHSTDELRTLNPSLIQNNISTDLSSQPRETSCITLNCHMFIHPYSISPIPSFLLPIPHQFHFF